MKVFPLFDEPGADAIGGEADPRRQSREQLLAYALDLSRMYRQIRETHAKLEEVYLSTLSSLVAAVEARDHYLDGHTKSVLSYASPLGKEMGLSGEDLETLRRAVLLHDIGKIGVPDSVLKKEGPLDKAEWYQMRRHPEIGYQILSSLSFLGEALQGVRHHHERHDGRGYPLGLAGDKIPWTARLVSVCDAFDAMTSDRSYRRAIARDQAIAQLADGRRTQFDPEAVEALVPILMRSETHPHPQPLPAATRPVHS